MDLEFLDTLYILKAYTLVFPISLLKTKVPTNVIFLHKLWLANRKTYFAHKLFIVRVHCHLLEMKVLLYNTM